MHRSACFNSLVCTCARDIAESIAGTWPALQKFPHEYTDAIRQAQNSTTAALAAGLRLLEIEFPTSSLASVSGALALVQVLVRRGCTC